IAVEGGMIAGCDFGARVPPFWLGVDGVIRDAAQFADNAAIKSAREAGNRRAGRRIHKGHKFVREARHRAANANAADIRATAKAVHPSTLGDVAIHNRPPAADFDETFGGAVFPGEVALLVITGAVATFVHGLSK